VLKREATVKVERVWIAIGSGVGFAILETNDEKALYHHGVTWSDPAFIAFVWSGRQCR
jgi:hypothetical protein